MVYKINESIIRIQAEALKPIETKAVFWSYDRGTAKLVIQLLRKDNIPQVLSEGTTVPIRLIFNSATAEGGIGKHDYLATIEDRLNGIVSITLEDNILGYVGTVRGSVYINFPDTRSLDTAGRFNFEIRRSPIDETTPELEDYYFNGFSQTIDKIEKIMTDGKQAIDQKIADSEQQINENLEETNNEITQVNQSIETLNHEITEANNRIDQTNQQISDLGNLKKMYSNSIDFGDYDYSGNPNLLPQITAKNFIGGTGATTKDLDNNEIEFVSDGTARISKYSTLERLPFLIEGQTYTMSYEMIIDELTQGSYSDLRLSYAYAPMGQTMLTTSKVASDEIGVWKTIKGTVTIKYATSSKPENWYLVLQDIGATANAIGKFRVRNFKVERGSTNTPVQPNLLVAPYQISKVALNEDIKNKTVQFPINTTAYSVYGGRNTKKYEAGKKYTVTLKGRKSQNQNFSVFMNSGTLGVGAMTPVEGQPDVWTKTFTVSQANIEAGVTDLLVIYQTPNSSLGQCTIEWLKVEEGDTATPPISFYKYFGEGLKDSNNPNDYSWDVTSAYTEKSLNEKVSLTEPQSIAGTKNFLEQPLISGERISTEKFGISLTGGQLSGVPVSDGTVLNWGRPYAYDNERSKTNDLFTISEDTKTLTILKNCALQFVGKFTCQTNNASYYAYLGIRVNGASDWRVAGIGGDLNWRNDVGWFCVRKFNAGDRVTLVTGTNYKTDSVNAWGVDQVYIREILTS
ncbi:BppU family phage baseplate upper protein [Enterococcus mundtii]|uniref:BppU family phage baseplate upper protein n=1 Tax=Enterococcus mundtii TaxID=53346 RepID=UPI00232FE468|nr:BppU family phage baseplate upper protein [Enterococcus mundtii]MDB7086936.1 BppU family phage baseplate upper protein [Enterococcus mundtii]